MNELSGIELEILSELNDYLRLNNLDIIVSLDDGNDTIKFPAVTMDIFNIADGLKTMGKQMYSQRYFFTIAIYNDGEGRLAKNRKIAEVVSAYFWSIGFRRSHNISVPNYKDKSIARQQLRFVGNITKDRQVY